MNKAAAIKQPVLVAFQTIIWKEVLRFMRIWTQTLLPPAITLTLYFIIFGTLIGPQINAIQGFSYIQYIVPGLIMMAIITNSYANTVSSFFMAKFNRSIEEMLVAPVPNYIILCGFTLSGAMRGLLVGIIVVFISLLFTHLHISNLLIVISIATLSALLFSLGGFINAIFAKNFDDISFVPTFVLTPLTYLGGVFYSIEQLPPFWRKLSMFNPILNIVDTFRYGLLGISDVNIYVGFGLIIVCVIILYIWAWYLLDKGVGIKS